MNEQRDPRQGRVADVYRTENSNTHSTGEGSRQQPRMVRIAELSERTSGKGARYFSGFMGDAQVLLFDGGERDHPTRPGERVHVWRLFVQERDPSRRPGGGR